MSNAQNTPAPWRLDTTSESGETYVLGCDITTQGVSAWSVVAKVHGINGAKEANARLIAAAPEMLAALREAEAAALAVNRGAGETVFNPAALAIIREALAKADGGAA